MSGDDDDSNGNGNDSGGSESREDFALARLGDKMQHYYPSAEMVLVRERQRELLRRLIQVEKQQAAMSKMLNRGLGGTAAVVGIGVLFGWLLSIAGNISNWFKGH